MKKLFQFFKPSLPLALLGVILVGSVALIELYQIQLMAQIIDVGIANQDMNTIIRVGLMMVGLALFGALIAVFGLIIPAHVASVFGLRLRMYLFSKIQAFSAKNIHRFSSASLVTRLTNDIDVISRTLMTSLRLLVRAPILLISAVTMTYMTNRELSYVMLIAVASLMIVLGVIIHFGFVRFVLLQEKVDQLNHRIQEALVNIRVIKSFVREDFEDENFRRDNQAFYDASMNANLLMLLTNPAFMIALNLASIVVIYIASYLIIDVHALAVGDLIVFITYLRFTMFSMMMLSFLFTMITRSKASLLRLRDVIDEPITIMSVDTPTKVSNKAGDIEFRDVSFRYYDKAVDSVLSNLNFTIKHGERIGIIGSTGSGKTTLINLLVRLMDINEGEILIDGVDIKTLDLAELRSYFGFVPQKNVLFSGTIEENLKFGSKDIDHDAIEKAAKTASIYDFIVNTDAGYQSTVAQGGTNFSGGQRQRLCIARALATHPQVLVLDDSTSALDAATEKAVMDAIKANYPSMTILNIAQKISSVRAMDRILVMNEGRIVESGTHAFLLENSRVYQEIYESQQKREDEL